MKLVTYLSFESNSLDVINYYQSIIGGEITNVQKYGDMPDFDTMPELHGLEDKLIHGRLELDDFEIYFSDSHVPVVMGDNISLSLQFTDLIEIERVFELFAVDASKVVMPLGDTFWNARYGALVDKFGIHWQFNCDYGEIKR